MIALVETDISDTARTSRGASGASGGPAGRKAPPFLACQNTLKEEGSIKYTTPDNVRTWIRMGCEPKHEPEPISRTNRKRTNPRACDRVMADVKRSRTAAARTEPN